MAQALADEIPVHSTPAWRPRQFLALTLLALAASWLLRAVILLRGSNDGATLAAVGEVAAGSGPWAGISPLQWLLSQVAGGLAPLEYWPLALCLLTLWLGYGAAAWLAARALTATPGTRLALLIWLVFSPMAVPGLAVWPVGVSASGLAIGALLATYGAARLLDGLRVRAAVAIVAGTVLALASTGGSLADPGILVAPWVVVIVGLPGLIGRPAPDSRRVVAIAIGAAIVPAALYATWSIITHGPPGALPRDLGSPARFVGESLGSGALPALAGGPLAWEPGTLGWPSADAGGLVTFLGIQVALAGLASCILLTRRGLAPAMIGATFAVMSVLLFAITRPPAQAGAGSDMLGVSLVPVVLAPFLIAALSSAPEWRRPEWSTPARRAIAAFAVIDAFIALSAMTTIAWSDARIPYAGEAYVTAAAASLAQASRDSPVLPQVVPPQVVDPRYAPSNSSDIVFAPARERPAFATWATTLRALDDVGMLRSAVLEGVDVSVACSTWTPRISLPQPLPEFTYVLAISLPTGFTDGFTVQLGDGPATAVPPDIGTPTVYVQVTGSGSSVALTSLGDQPVCPQALRIGQVRPLTPAESEAPA